MILTRNPMLITRRTVAEPVLWYGGRFAFGQTRLIDLFSVLRRVFAAKARGGEVGLLPLCTSVVAHPCTFQTGDIIPKRSMELPYNMPINSPPWHHPN